MGTDFKVGDLVKFTVGSGFGARDAVGKITKVTKAGGLTIVANGTEYNFRKKKYGTSCSHLTDHEKATLEWLQKRPKTTYLDYKWPWVRGALDAPECVVPTTSNTSINFDNIAEVRDELRYISDWWWERPKVPVVKDDEEK